MIHRIFVAELSLEQLELCCKKTMEWKRVSGSNENSVRGRGRQRTEAEDDERRDQDRSRSSKRPREGVQEKEKSPKRRSTPAPPAKNVVTTSVRSKSVHPEIRMPVGNPLVERFCNSSHPILMVVDMNNIAYSNNVSYDEERVDEAVDWMIARMKTCRFYVVSTEGTRHQKSPALIKAQKAGLKVQFVRTGVNDDIIVLEVALRFNGFVLSNDYFRDHVEKKRISFQDLHSRRVGFKFGPNLSFRSNLMQFENLKFL